MIFPNNFANTSHLDARMKQSSEYTFSKKNTLQLVAMKFIDTDLKTTHF